MCESTCRARFREVLNRVDGVERTAIGSSLVVGVLDPSVSNGWGRLTQVVAMVTPDAPFPGNPLVVAGRMYNPAAADEVVISDDAARAAGIHVGDVIHLSGWHQADLDAAADGQLAPETPVFTSKVVGIVRALEDVQASNAGNLSDSNFPGDVNVYAGPAWTAAHGPDLSGYGTGVLVRLRGGASATRAFAAELNKAPEGWYNQAQPLNDVDPASVRRVLDLERRALLVFAFIAISAGVAFVGLTAARQLRREAAEATRLAALGMTRRDLRMSNVARGSDDRRPRVCRRGHGDRCPLTTRTGGPRPQARVRSLDAVRLARAGRHVARNTHLVLVRGARHTRGLAGNAPVPSEGADLTPRPRVAQPRTGRRRRRDHRRGRSSRAAIAVTAVAIAAGVAAGGLVASYDRLVAAPERYGASWDVAVGQYSQPDALAAGIAKLPQTRR